MTDTAFGIEDRTRPAGPPAPPEVLEPPPPPPPPAEPPAPTSRRATRRARRVKRVVRRVTLFSVLKVALAFYACIYVLLLTCGVLLWGFASSSGLLDDFESFMNDVGFSDFRFVGDEMFRQAVVIGFVLVLAGSVLTTLAAALFNVISELTGGIRIIVIEEDPHGDPDEPQGPRPLEPPAPPVSTVGDRSSW